MVQPQWPGMLCALLKKVVMPSRTPLDRRSGDMIDEQDRVGLLSDRWRPYFFGCLAGIPVALVMLQVWRHWDYVAVTWLFLYMFLAGLDIFWKNHARKLISTALMVGTIVPPFLR
jgi:hypothetical protein